MGIDVLLERCWRRVGDNSRDSLTGEAAGEGTKAARTSKLGDSGVTKVGSAVGPVSGKNVIMHASCWSRVVEGHIAC